MNMPGYRRTRRIVRRRRGRKTPWYNRRYSPMQLARQAYRGVNYLRGLVNSELLKKDNTYTTTNMDYTIPTVSSLCAIAQGDSVSGRTGNSIYVRSVSIKLLFTPSSATAVNSIIKVALVMDTQQIGDSAPGFGDIYEQTGVDGITSPLAIATVGRFKILLSDSILLKGAEGTARIYEKYLKMRHHVRYNGTSSSDIQKGNLYLVMISNRTSTNLPSYSGNVRVSYHDN